MAVASTDPTSGYATAAEAKSMLERAATELKSDPTVALAKFNNTTGPFRDRDLYVFCFDMLSGRMTAAYDESLLGTDIRTLKDAAGSPLGSNIFNSAIEDKISTVEFNWPRPGHSEAVPKEAYVTRVGDEGCGVGYYIRVEPGLSVEPSPDQPLLDVTPYGSGKNDSISDATETAATTQHTLTINGKCIAYTATAGHLVTTDMYAAQPTAKIFYVAFTANGSKPAERAVTFFYNGGPGSSAVYLLLGSFGPRRIKTNMPYFTPPAPYELEDNLDSLLDHSDLVFINPVGTGYSTAIAPHRNGDFWGVDQDARSIKQFIKRYLTNFGRWNSPKFLFGESYGTPRTCVLTWMLHEDGVDLNGVILQSSILDYSQQANSIGLLPTLAADAWFHKRVSVSPPPVGLPPFLKDVEDFASGPYASAKAAFPNVDQTVLQGLSDILGVPSDVLKYWRMDLAAGNATPFLTNLLLDEGLAVGAYDGRVTAEDDGIAAAIAPNSGGNDPTITAIGGVYTAMWNVYLNQELKFTATAPFMDLNDEAFLNWDFGHIDPTGTQKGGIDSLYTAGDLAAAMALNPYLKVFSANGYFDAVTPYFQTVLNFANMPVIRPQEHHNLTVMNYPSGHMIYLDNPSRSAMKVDLTAFYESAIAHPLRARVFLSAGEAASGERLTSTPYRRRFGRTPY